MMSTQGKVVPLSLAPIKPPCSGVFELTPVPGLSPQAIQGLKASYPGLLTDEMRSLLQTTCGFTAAEFGTIDLTSRWHPAEPIDVFHPCVTLSIDDEGRRWIAETSRSRGLPGPVWCVLTDPPVALYTSDDLAGFLGTVDETARRGRLLKWLHGLDQEARAVWHRRQALAEESYQNCREDRELRGWLAGLPFDARIYDPRARSTMRGWPYGLAGPDGRLHRFGRLPVFAVSTAPSVNRWSQHMIRIAAVREPLAPAVARSLAA